MKYCPLCWTESDGCCDVCGWYGDENELLDGPGQGFNFTLALVKVLSKLRDLHRYELQMEALVTRGEATQVNLRNVGLDIRDATHRIIHMCVKLREQSDTLKIVLIAGQSGLVPWPDDWLDRHYNACNEPCDMLIGPCACGAWHCEGEQWVQEILKKHNAVIVHEDNPNES
jgi:hypothetical protein